jgi:hypothetical protein
VAELLLRFAEGVFGFTLIVAVAFLYEDEEGQVQDRIQELWVGLSRIQPTALSRHTAFLSGATRLVDRVLVVIYGERLLSARAFSISFLLQAAVAFTLVSSITLLAIVLHRGWGKPGSVVSLGLMALLLWWAILRSFQRPQGRTAQRAALALVAFMICTGFIVSGSQPGHRFSASTSWRILELAMSCAVIMDIAAVALLRRLIRTVSSANSFRSQLMLLLGVAMIVVLVALPGTIAYHRENSPELSAFGLSLIGLTITTLIPPGLLLGLLLTLGLHRIGWPLLLRSLYAVHRHSLFNNRKTILGIGSAFVLVACRPAWAAPLGRAMLDKIGITIPQ